jgi:hemerythrin-like domain-containing protein
MRATEILKDEHRIIEQALSCLEVIAGQAEANGSLDGDSARQILNFFQCFADRCHHGKEENHLFPMMEARGIVDPDGPTAVMLAEHEEGRRHVRAMARKLQAAAAGQRMAVMQFAHHARGYANLMRQHILKEDQNLFPIADTALGVKEQQALLGSFDKVETMDLLTGMYDHFIEMADALALRFHVPRSHAEQESVRRRCHHAHP